MYSMAPSGSSAFGIFFSPSILGLALVSGHPTFCPRDGHCVCFLPLLITKIFTCPQRLPSLSGTGTSLLFFPNSDDFLSVVTPKYNIKLVSR
ncbi:hypothetical protein F5J12DRAFT_48651 [Pisolithus orientalis]|uniref:uncharacterized protein n=1 Tax=Pisolithus orientalis TaxID=936130 RepID=UPI002225933D|nr:uncharacterized protein F5J12DRAFT_48651 [Pisolithus orientalis]KAI6008689.1 hypothetical protein F5J12DRAFT_48651 [Pisolithus orientalis]